MASRLKSGWSKPSTILFASEVPINEKAFEFAVAQAKQLNADLILFHAYDTLLITDSETRGICYDPAAAAKVEKQHLAPMAERVRDAGVHCEVVVRPGLAADQILAYASERDVDRIVMGSHSPGPIGKVLVGSVAEAVLRTASIPVCIVGPNVVSGASRDFAIRTILCAVSLQDASATVATFAAALAIQHHARLILQHVIRPQDHAEILARRTLDDIESDLQNLVLSRLREKTGMQTIVVSGDPTQELLYQSRTQDADLIVLGAHGASAFAAITRHGIVYKTLAHAHCPVITLSPVMLAAYGPQSESGRQHRHIEGYTAGVI